MKRIRVVNKTRDRELGSRVAVADRWWQRTRGFLGRAEPVPGEGILLSPCRAVHMWGMGFALDVVFLDREGVVEAVYPALRPRGMTKFHRRAEYAVELPAGVVQETGTVPGDRIVWMPEEVPEAAFSGRRTDSDDGVGR